MKLLIAFVSIFTIFLIAFIVQLPFSKVLTLKNSYVHSTYKDGQISYSFSKRRPQNWVSLGEINKVAAKAILISEDSFFYQHSGVDIQQLRMAFKDRLFEGKRMRGASAITQQVIKNLFLSHERSIFRKFNELVLALYIEKHLSKSRILEIYLNIIEYGEGLYGIKNATSYYFDKLPSSLTPKEGAFLAMLLPSPKRYAQSFKEKKLTEYANEIIESLLKKLVVAGAIDDQQFQAEMERPLAWEENRGGAMETLLEEPEIYQEQ